MIVSSKSNIAGPAVEATSLPHEDVADIRGDWRGTKLARLRDPPRFNP